MHIPWGIRFNLAEVRKFCDRHRLWLVEDNCDALGSEYTINGETKFTGTWGDIGTSSFYPPHHMTMGEGGCVYTNNAKLSRLYCLSVTGDVTVSVLPGRIISVDTGMTDSLDSCHPVMTINMCTAILDII